jgi:hypothetical protein
MMVARTWISFVAARADGSTLDPSNVLGWKASGQLSEQNGDKMPFAIITSFPENDGDRETPCAASSPVGNYPSAANVVSRSRSQRCAGW